MSMDFEVHCMFILPTELSLFNYDKVKSVLQSLTPLNYNLMCWGPFCGHGGPKQPLSLLRPSAGPGSD